MNQAFMAERAAELVELLGGCCDRLEVAGSLRRQAADVGDVELVAVPHLAPSPYAGDLFGGSGVAGKIDYLAEKLRELKGRGVLRDRPDKHGRPAWGEKFVRALYGDRPAVAVDLFIVRPPASWGVILFIRTGPAEYVKAAMGRLLERGLSCAEGRIVNHAGVPQPTPEEADVFALLGWEPKDPAERGRQRPRATALELPPQAPPTAAVSTRLDDPLPAAPPPRPRARGCPPHDWHGELAEAEPGCWRPTCTRCGETMESRVE